MDNTKYDRVSYDHREKFGLGLRVAVAAITGIGALVILAVCIASLISEGFAWTILALVLPAALLAATAAWIANAYIYIHFDQTGGRLGIRSWPTYAFKWNEVADIKAASASAIRAGGIGYRYTGRKSRALLTRSGKGIVLTFQDGRSLTVGCASPEQAVSYADTYLRR